MQRVLNWLRSAFRANPAPARPRAVRPQLERLDDRLVPSVSSAMTTKYSWGTVHDFFGIDQTTHQVVDFRLGSGGQWSWQFRPGFVGSQSQIPQNVESVSASINPANGSAEVFALDGNGELWLGRFTGPYDGSGTWKPLGGPGVGHGGVGYSAITATRDDHVYTDQFGGDIQYVDSNGNGTDLGRPVSYGYSGSQGISAGSGWWGQNEVFAIGWDNKLYVNSSNSSGGWRLVDGSASFTALAATQGDQVFALDTKGHMHLETEHFGSYRYYGYWYWTGPDISQGMTFSGGPNGEIYADTDASGQAEVYAFAKGSSTLYRYDQGPWQYKDSSVLNAAAADGGYFFDVNVGGSAWAYDPSLPYPWNHIGDNVE